MRLKPLVEYASNKENFTSLSNYISFANRFLDFAASGLQATIVCQNENQYQFWQYKKDGNFNISRPLNSNLMYDASQNGILTNDFLQILTNAKDLPVDDAANRAIICNSIYTIQQCIGVSLDALSAGQSNRARKINGDLFERLIRLLLQNLNIDCTSGCVRVPIKINDVEQFKMNYQHDLILKSGDTIKAIGSVKTSSKDRIDKIFIDKFLFNQLTGVDTPHLAIFLNDVQRGKKMNASYKVSSTFLPGHFKGYTLKLNPLDGVYYCDIRQSMESDVLLKAHIKTIDHFFCNDLWTMLSTAPEVEGDIKQDKEK